MTTVLLVDNYDSFTFNLAQAMSALGADVTVLRADDPGLDAALDARPDRVVISPGPGRPEVAGRSPAIVRSAPERGIPTLGVCLGLQCVAVAFGAAVVRAPEPRHGKTSAVRHDGKGLFAGIPDPTIATRYHSLMVDPTTMPAELEVTARSDDGVVMAIRHRTLPLEAVQFHPESVLSGDGVAMLRNFLESPQRTPPKAAVGERLQRTPPKAAVGESLQRTPPKAAVGESLQRTPPKAAVRDGR